MLLQTNCTRSPTLYNSSLHQTPSFIHSLIHQYFQIKPNFSFINFSMAKISLLMGLWLCMVLAALCSRCLCLEDHPPSSSSSSSSHVKLSQNEVPTTETVAKNRNQPGRSFVINGGNNNVRKILQTGDCPFCPGCGCHPTDDCRNCCDFVGC